MRRASCVLAAALVAAVTGIPGCGREEGRTATGPAPHASCAGPLLGVQTTLTDVAGAGERARAVAALRDTLHARVARVVLSWPLVEPRPGARDWSRTDAIVDELTSAGIEPLFVVAGSPSWANGAASASERGNPAFRVPVQASAFAAWVDRYARFVRAAAERYGGRVPYWEIWNEPNLAAFWAPRPDPGRYARLYRALAGAIGSAAPDARVAVGGLAALGVARRGDVRGLPFLERLLREEGLRPEAVAIHPYTRPPHAPGVHLAGANNFDDIAAVEALVHRDGADAAIWVTEWGWSSRGLGPARQAAYLRRSLELLRTRYRYVALATYFLDRDVPPRFHEGLLTASLRPKPAARVFAQAVGAACGEAVR